MDRESDREEEVRRWMVYEIRGPILQTYVLKAKSTSRAFLFHFPFFFYFLFHKSQLGIFLKKK
jgi:hypothetical protein